MGRKAGSKEFRDKIEERKGTDWYDKALQQGLYDPHMSRDGKTARYSGAEVRAEMRAGRGDRTTEEMTKYFEDAYASGQINLNGNAKEFLREKHGANLRRDGDGGNDDGGTTSPTQGSSGPQTTGNIETGPDSIVSPINQDNDLSVGNNNSGTVSQDNSITNTIDNSDNSRRYYGGSNRTFNYNGGDGESRLYDSPVSAATMGGFYDTDDSPAAANKFMDMYIDSNIRNQRDIRKDYDKYKNTNYGPNDPDRIPELEGRLDRSVKESRDRADKQELKMFGDNPFSGTFNLPQLATPVVDNTQDIYEDAMDRIKKI